MPSLHQKLFCQSLGNFYCKYNNTSLPGIPGMPGVPEGPGGPGGPGISTASEPTKLKIQTNVQLQDIVFWRRKS